MPPSISIEIGPGELLDRISILRIRLGFLEEKQRADAEAQLAKLEATWREQPAPRTVHALAEELAEVNRRLWQLEDALRSCEARGDFGRGFVEQARGVYRANDRRAELKAAIDAALGCAARDPKVYAARE